MRPISALALALVVSGLLVVSLVAAPAAVPRAPLTTAIPPPLNCKPTSSPLGPATSPTVEASVEPNPGDAEANLTFCSVVSGVTGAYTLNWSFGDGHASSEPDPLHAYATANNYTVTFTLNSSSYNTSRTFYAYVNSALGVQASYSPSNPTTATVVDFSASYHDGTPPYVTSWNFTDGTTTSGPAVNHTFHSSGTHTVEIITNDSGGGQVIEYLQISVKSTAQPTGNIDILIGTTAAAVAVGLGGFAYLQYDKRRKPKRPTLLQRPPT